MEIKDGEYQKPNFIKEAVDEYNNKAKELFLLEGEYKKPNLVPVISKRGKLTKPQIVFDEEMYRLVAAYKFVGKSDREIAKLLKMGLTTLNKTVKKDPILRNIIEDSKQYTNGLAVSGLIKNIIAGNLQAQIFWLKNNMSDKFSDKAELTVTGTMDRDTAVKKLNEQLFGEEKSETK